MHWSFSSAFSIFTHQGLIFDRHIANECILLERMLHKHWIQTCLVTFLQIQPSIQDLAANRDVHKNIKQQVTTIILWQKQITSF